MKIEVNSDELSNKEDEDNFEEFTDNATLIEASETIENSKFFFRFLSNFS